MSPLYVTTAKLYLTSLFDIHDCIVLFFMYSVFAIWKIPFEFMITRAQNKINAKNDISDCCCYIQQGAKEKLEKKSSSDLKFCPNLKSFVTQFQWEVKQGHVYSVFVSTAVFDL